MSNARHHRDPALPGLRHFTDSPDEGDPDCLCSYCGNRIEAADEDQEDGDDDDDKGLAVRMWPEDGRYEIRLHPRCLNEVLELGILKM